MAATDSKQQEELYFQIGHCYLLKYINSNQLYEVKVLQITNKSVKFQGFSSDGTSHTNWMLIEEFNRKYVIFEEIPEQVIPFEKVPSEGAKDYYMETTEKCPICGGEGEIPEPKSTTGKKECPKCWGSKRIWKTP